jgi:signal transduction histidine kinase
VRGLYGQLMAVTSAVLVVTVGISLWVLYAFGVTSAVANARTNVASAIAQAAAAARISLSSSLASPAAATGLRSPAMAARERSLGGVLAVVDRGGEEYWSHPRNTALVGATAHLPRPDEAERIGVSGDTVWAAAAVPFRGPQRHLYVVWRVPVRPPAFPTQTQVGVMVSGLAAIVLAQILWALVAQRLTRPLEALLIQLDRYAQGDFATRPAIRAPAEFMRLADAMGRMGQALAAERSAREAFLAEVAHDLRTPLTAIRGLIGALAAGADTDPAVARERLARAGREADRLSRLVNDLLDLARYESGHLAIAVGPVDLREVAALGAVSGEAAAAARGVRFEVTQPDAPVWVSADLDRGAQILVNLIDNAVRYTPAGGSVYVHVGHDGERGILDVEDTGPGFEPGAADWAWSAFARGKAARENDGGTGLGLAVGRALARVMRGDLRILPPAGALGGRVRLELPLTEPPAALPPGAAASS